MNKEREEAARLLSAFVRAQPRPTELSGSQLRAMFADVASPLRPWGNVLAAAVEDHVPQRISQYSSACGAAVVDELAELVAISCCCKRDVAVWAVRAWCDALGVKYERPAARPSRSGPGPGATPHRNSTPPTPATSATAPSSGPSKPAIPGNRRVGGKLLAVWGTALAFIAIIALVYYGLLSSGELPATKEATGVADFKNALASGSDARVFHMLSQDVQTGLLSGQSVGSATKLRAVLGNLDGLRVWQSGNSSATLAPSDLGYPRVTMSRDDSGWHVREIAFTTVQTRTAEYRTNDRVVRTPNLPKGLSVPVRAGSAGTREETRLQVVVNGQAKDDGQVSSRVLKVASSGLKWLGTGRAVSGVSRLVAGRDGSRTRQNVKQVASSFGPADRTVWISWSVRHRKGWKDTEVWLCPDGETLSTEWSPSRVPWDWALYWSWLEKPQHGNGRYILVTRLNGRPSQWKSLWLSFK